MPTPEPYLSADGDWYCIHIDMLAQPPATAVRTEALHRHWWLVDDAGFARFRRRRNSFAPQANIDRRVAETILGSGAGAWASTIVQLPVAFVAPLPKATATTR